VLAGFPLTWIGHQTLDAQPTPARAEWVTTAVHFALMVPFGASIIAAVRVGQVWRIGLIPVPSEVGLTLMLVTGVGVLLAMLNRVQLLLSPSAECDALTSNSWRIFGRFPPPVVLQILQMAASGVQKRPVEPVWVPISPFYVVKMAQM
jgi:hypothetical protein